MAYEQHDILVQALLKEMQKVPPTGYAKVSFEQLQRADREVWTQIAQSCPAGLAPLPDGKFPAGEALQRAVVSHAFTALCAHLPAPPPQFVSGQAGNNTSSSTTRKRPVSKSAPKAKAKMGPR
eukprot:6308551-Amphidinium_carterae.1